VDTRTVSLVFFSNANGVVHHVGIYAGGGMMVESPRTGESIRISPLRSGYAGALFLSALDAVDATADSAPEGAGRSDPE
jgi:NlpC/P60 family